METKKNPKADLSRKSGLILSFSFLLSLSLIIAAFEFNYKEPQVAIIDFNPDYFKDNSVVPITEIKTVEPPKIKAVQIIEVKEDEPEDDLKNIIDIETTENDAVEVIEVEEPVEKEEPDVIEVFPEESASPMGGMRAFYKYVGDNIKYPMIAKRTGTKGKVFVEFVINKDGSLTDIKVVKGIGAGCDEEAMRVLQAAPKWSPGKQRGKPVRQRMVIPIVFTIND